MARKVKAEIDKDGRISFLNDDDGVSERDFLIIITSLVFFGGVAMGLVILVASMFTPYELPDKYIELINVMTNPLMVILGGLFTVKTAQVVTNKKNEKREVDNYEDIV